jgi:protoheme IX farnesyltransferase
LTPESFATLNRPEKQRPMATDLITSVSSSRRRSNDDSNRLPSVAKKIVAEKIVAVQGGAGARSKVKSASLWRDCIELTKPRIVTMILVTTVATALNGAGGWVSLVEMCWLLFGTALIAGSAGAANQVWERTIDRHMTRTATRPLPSGRMETLTAVVFTVVLGMIGTAVLNVKFGLTPAVAGIATWLVYVLIYTPMKTRTAWNTTVGAIAGALPVLIGYTATGGNATDWTAWLLVGVLAAWQYPHFMAIAWLCRDQYAEAGFCMTTTVEPSGRSAGWQSIAGSLALIACGVWLCLIPAGIIGAMIGSIAVVAASLPMLLASIRFLAEPGDVLARKLLRSSLLVLPAVLLVITLRVFW